MIPPDRRQFVVALKRRERIPYTRYWGSKFQTPWRWRAFVCYGRLHFHRGCVRRRLDGQGAECIGTLAGSAVSTETLHNYLGGSLCDAYFKPQLAKTRPGIAKSQPSRQSQGSHPLPTNDGEAKPSDMPSRW